MYDCHGDSNWQTVSTINMYDGHSWLFHSFAMEAPSNTRMNVETAQISYPRGRAHIDSHTTKNRLPRKGSVEVPQVRHDYETLNPFHRTLHQNPFPRLALAAVCGHVQAERLCNRQDPAYHGTKYTLRMTFFGNPRNSNNHGYWRLGQFGKSKLPDIHCEKQKHQYVWLLYS